MENIVNVHVPQAGALKKTLISQGMNTRNITGLKVIGKMGVRDFEFIRTMLSGLTTLDISEVSISEIPCSAFENCSNLESVQLPSSVTAIGYEAFSECTKLTAIEIPPSVTVIATRAFSGCTKLTTVGIPPSVIDIGSGAFDECFELTEIFLPASVRFYYNSISTVACDVAKVIIDSKNPYFSTEDDIIYNKDKDTLWIYPKYKENRYYTIPSSVTAIESCAFYRCRVLTSITIPASVSCIGNSAFAFSGLTTIEIPSSVDHINPSTFKNCEDLSSVIIPFSVTEIGASAFSGCTCLSSVVIPSSVTHIGGEAFQGCTRLSSVVIPSSVTHIGEGAFRGCTGLTSVTILASVSVIESRAFEGCSGLVSVTIPPKVTTIHCRAFNGCKKLTSVIIPPSVHTIGIRAFLNCFALVNLTIPSSVREIDEGAFDGCVSLECIHNYAEEDFDFSRIFGKWKIDSICHVPIHTTDTTWYTKAGKQFKAIEHDLVPVSSIVIDTDKMSSGEIGTLVATAFPNDATNKNVVWSSHCEQIVNIDKDGNVTVGVKVVLTATSEDGCATTNHEFFHQTTLLQN